MTEPFLDLPPIIPGPLCYAPAYKWECWRTLGILNPPPPPTCIRSSLTTPSATASQCCNPDIRMELNRTILKEDSKSYFVHVRYWGTRKFAATRVEDGQKWFTEPASKESRRTLFLGMLYATKFAPVSDQAAQKCRRRGMLLLWPGLFRLLVAAQAGTSNIDPS